MNYKDVALLNGSLDEISDSLLKRKMLDEQSRERSAQTDLQKQRLQVDQDRWNKTAAYQQRMESKADQQNTLQQNRAALADKQKLLQFGIQANAQGQFSPEGRKKFNDFLANDEHFGPTGLQLAEPPQRISRQGLPTAVSSALYLKDFRDKANDMRDPDSPNFDPDGADQQDHYGDLIEQSLKKQPTSDDSITETQEFPEHPADPGAPAEAPSSGFLGIRSSPGKVAVPPTPYQPKRKVTIKHPPGWTPAAMTGKPLDPVSAAVYLQKAGGDKNKARALAVQDGWDLGQPAASPAPQQ